MSLDSGFGYNSRYDKETEDNDLQEKCRHNQDLACMLQVVVFACLQTGTSTLTRKRCNITYDKDFGQVVDLGGLRLKETYGAAEDRIGECCE